MPTRDIDAPRWQRYARCAQPDVSPDWWDTTLNQGRVLEVMHICRHHCDVADECRADAHQRARDGQPYRGEVAGGEHWNGDGGVTAHRDPVGYCGELCARMTWPQAVA